MAQEKIPPAALASHRSAVLIFSLCNHVYYGGKGHLKSPCMGKIKSKQYIKVANIVL